MYLCYYYLSSAHTRVRAQKRVIIAGYVIIIRHFVVSKDCSRLLILLRLDRQYYNNVLALYDLHDNKKIISVPIATKSAQKLARVLFFIAFYSVRFGFSLI